MAETPEDIGQKLQALLDSRDLRAVKRSFRDFETADLGEALTALPLDTCLALFRLLPRKRRAETFAYLPFDRQEQLLEELPDIVVTPILNDMEPDDRTRLLEELPFELRSKLLLRLTPEERKIAWQLLSHPEGSVGRLMTPELFVLSADMQVNEIMAMLRWAHSIPEDQLNTLFITDEKGHCVGEVSLATLVTADPPTRKVGEVMQPHQAILRASDEQSVAVDFFRKYDRASFPVVDDQGVLVGIVTADDVFDVAEEEATEDIQQFGGQSTLEDSYFETPLLTLFKKRAGWLALLFLGGTFTAACIKHYESYSDAMGWLVFFLPLIVSAGGNTGSQSASLVIRGIAVREMELKDWFRVMWREIVVGLALGLILGAMGYLRAVAWHLEPVVGISVAVSVAGVVIFGSVTGAMLPFLFKRLKLDPAVISSPLLAQTVDIVGVLVFYNVAAIAIAHWQRMLKP